MHKWNMLRNSLAKTGATLIKVASVNKAVISKGAAKK